MFTQCPDCKTAFRVTAEVLKQASGKVRCGGCGNAFNALEYLSEQKPSTEAPKPPETPLPELTPEPDESLPKSISAEQSAALLKTLDELAGSNIRIEDPGVEWRVLDDEDDGDKGIVIIAKGAPGIVKLKRRILTQAIVNLGSIKGDGNNVALFFVQDVLIFHNDTSFLDLILSHNPHLEYRLTHYKNQLSIQLIPLLSS